MKFTCYLTIVIIPLLYTLTDAYTWTISMSCGNDLEMKIEHANDQGHRVIQWDVNRIHPNSKVCSQDQAICVKDVYVSREECQRVSFKFKVQYNSQWSTENNVEIVGVKSLLTSNVISDIYPFEPTFV
ncbi:hypothetical protein EDC96DRAFT_603406 [Choanephora cucurbitarum]|nr:hypothetical protein EDC96DRAFT_603406 [Choanephora cucurbitarum]